MSKVVSSQNIALYDSCPIGVIIAFPAAAIPNGWLECNGQAISRAAYAELFALVGTTYGIGDGASTFNLPDYRGVFLRGKDNGKGYDAGRALGVFQEMDIQSHSHLLRPVSSLNNGSTNSICTSTDTTNGFVVPTGIQAAGGLETRPKNVSVVFCIKAVMAITTGLSTVSTFAALTHITHQGEAVSFATNGYKKFADGLIIQWGTSVTSGGSGNFFFPIAFPAAAYTIVANPVVNGNVILNLYGLSLTGFSAASTINTGGAFSTGFYWQAIGR